jgi:hypothetical protein
MKHMESWGWLSPRPEIPFMGMSLKSICKRSETDMAMYWWQKEYCYMGRQEYKAHPCSLESKIDEILSSAMAKENGLRLQNGDVQLE